MTYDIGWFAIAAGLQDRRAGATTGIEHGLNGQSFAEGIEIRLDRPRSAEPLTHQRAK
jgi:hypothetical protein